MAIKLAHQQAKTPIDGKDVSTRDYADAAGGPADDLSTTGADVNVSAAAPPTSGQVLTASGATAATWQTPAPSADVAVKVTGADTTAGGLSAKVAAGSNISLAVLNPGANEQLEITSTGGTDIDSIHDNVAGEIAAVTTKATPIAADVVLIEDSADSFNKKKVTISDILNVAGPRAVRWVVDGTTDDHMVTIPGAAMADDSYVVVATQASLSGVSGIYSIVTPDVAAGDRTTTEFRVQTSVPLVSGDYIDFMIMDRTVADDHLGPFAAITWTSRPVDPGGNRDTHTVTKLDDGKILVAGGLQGATYLADCRLYDPSTGIWSAAGSMILGRIGHAAVKLPNGKVLVVGGVTPGGVRTNTCEIYDPGLNTWSGAAAHPSTSIVRPSIHVITAGAEIGNVLVSAGEYNIAASNASDVYNVAGNTWGGTSVIPAFHLSHGDIILPDGRIILFGGLENEGVSPGSQVKVSIWDPATNTWSAGALLPGKRVFAGTALLPSGKVLIVGGSDETAFPPTVLATSEVYDPTGNSYVAGPVMATARFHHITQALSDGRVLVAGGAPTNATITSTAEIYDEALGTFTATVNMNFGVAHEDPTAGQKHWVLTDELTVFHVGGYTLGPYAQQDDSEEYVYTYAP